MIELFKVTWKCVVKHRGESNEGSSLWIFSCIISNRQVSISAATQHQFYGDTELSDDLDELVCGIEEILTTIKKTALEEDIDMLKA